MYYRVLSCVDHIDVDFNCVQFISINNFCAEILCVDFICIKCYYILKTFYTLLCTKYLCTISPKVVD